MLLNPVLISVVVLCSLCLMKLNVLMSLILSALCGAMLAGIPIPQATTILCDGFGANAGTALAYIFLGAFASAVARTGLADMMSKKLSRVVGKNTVLLLLALTGVACLSQNLIPVHIAFIPIMVPPLLSLFNEMNLDRRGVACALAFGLKAPYICVPFGFGMIFMKIISDNLLANGMDAPLSAVASVNWILGLAMFAGLLIAVMVTYRKPRRYNAAEADMSAEQAALDTMTRAHAVTLVAVVVVVAVQVMA